MTYTTNATNITISGAIDPRSTAELVKKAVATKKIEQLTVAVKSVDDSEYEHGEFEAILSAPTLDRDGEIVAPKAFEPLPEHITIDVDHALKTSGVVGSGVPYYDGDILKVKGRFASTILGQEIRTLVTEGHIRTMSVAIRGAQKETKDGVTTIKAGELLNAAFVAVPANREALIVAAKAGARHSGRDREALATYLDAVGWVCPACAEKTSTEEEEKAAEEPLDLWARAISLAAHAHTV